MHCNKARALRLWATMLCSFIDSNESRHFFPVCKRVQTPMAKIIILGWALRLFPAGQKSILSKKYTSHLIYYVSKCSYGNNSFGAGSFELSTDSYIIEYSLKCGTSNVIMEPVSLFLSHYDTLSYDRKPINGLKELQTLLLPLQCFKPARKKLNRQCLFYFDILRSES